MGVFNQERMFTEDQEFEIANEYLEGGVTMQEVADKWGCSRSLVAKILDRTHVMEKMEKRASRRTQRALIRLKMASADAAEKLVRLTQKERGDEMVYADIQLLGQVLDRAGVREASKEDKNVSVSFSSVGGISPKMPVRADGEDE